MLFVAGVMDNLLSFVLQYFTIIFIDIEWDKEMVEQGGNDWFDQPECILWKGANRICRSCGQRYKYDIKP